MQGDDFKRAYKILGVTPLDSDATIRKAWIGLVRAYHPDAYRGDSEAANARLAEINAAYDVVEADTSRAVAQAQAEATARKADALKRAAQREFAAQRARAARRDAQKRRAEAEMRIRREKMADPSHKAQVVQASKHARKTAESRPWSQAEIVAARAARRTFSAAKRAMDKEAGSRRLILEVFS